MNSRGFALCRFILRRSTCFIRRLLGVSIKERSLDPKHRERPRRIYQMWPPQAKQQRPRRSKIQKFTYEVGLGSSIVCKFTYKVALASSIVRKFTYKVARPRSIRERPGASREGRFWFHFGPKISVLDKRSCKTALGLKKRQRAKKKQRA